MEDIAIRFVQAHPTRSHIEDALNYPAFLSQWLTSQGIPPMLQDDAIALIKEATQTLLATRF